MFALDGHDFYKSVSIKSSFESCLWISFNLSVSFYINIVKIIMWAVDGIVTPHTISVESGSFHSYGFNFTFKVYYGTNYTWWFDWNQNALNLYLLLFSNICNYFANVI